MVPIAGVLKIVELGLQLYKDHLDNKMAETYTKNIQTMFKEMDKPPLKRDMAKFGNARRDNEAIEKQLELILMKELQKK